MTNAPRIYVTDQDFERLERLVGFSRHSDNLAALEEELERAIKVPSREIPPDVVTMDSTVHFRDESTGEEPEIVLVYPPDGDAEHGKISILAPVGSALLGLTVGQSIEWPMPDRSTRRLKVVAVVRQREASGQY